MDEIFSVPARKCKRCGRLLFSADALKSGYGCQCAKKAKKEELEKRPDPNQITLFNLETEVGDGESKNKCLTGQSKSGQCGAAACCSQTYKCCSACYKDCNIRCGWTTDPRKKTESEERGNERNL